MGKRMPPCSKPRTRELGALLLLSYVCPVTLNVMWLYLTMRCVGLRFVIVVFPGHTLLLFNFCPPER